MNKKIVIASILKPVDDVRAYWKIAQSLAKTNKYEVNIIGNKGKKESEYEKIHFYPHQILRKQFVKRILIRYTILTKILRIKPDILVVNTHELLIVAIISKILLRCKIIYDVQENYQLNASIHGVAASILGFFIRLKETLLASTVNQFWLAEKCYLEELRFAEHGIVVENKAIAFSKKDSNRESFRVIFSGTISEYSGIIKTIKIMIKLNELDENFEAVIIGQVHNPNLEKWVRNEVQSLENIKLIISRSPISYEDILHQIAWANLGIISYLSNNVNRAKVPTKLYEYSRYRIPFLVQKDSKWSEIGEHLGGAIPIDLLHADVDLVLDRWQNQEGLFPETYPNEETWESESIKIINSIESYTFDS